MRLKGGYYLLDQPLIRYSMHKHTSDSGSHISPELLDSINIVQSTKWTINRQILDVLEQAWMNGDVLGGLPSPEDEKLPDQIADDVWEKMPKQEKSAHKSRLAAVHSANAREQSKREELLRKLQLAGDLRDEQYIWMPHSIDFRGRLYPLPQDLHPQGDDVSRALLMFGDGKELGPTGARWLAIRLANNYGMDKMPLDERVKWTLDHESDIIDSATNPLDGYRFWNSAEEPWQFLAACMEWKMYLERGDSFVSHLPIHIDGSCNGLQHLSAMVRDPKGAKATNLTSSKERSDIYSAVADKVAEIVEADAKAGKPEAVAWRGKISRKVVKRGVMTLPYGVTDLGIRDQIIADRHTEGLPGSPMANANYLKDCLVSAIDDTISAARVVMGFLQGISENLAEHNIPFSWTTPIEFKVTQAYWGKVRSDIKTIYGKLSLWNEDKQIGLNKRKQMLASAPNVIHSFDAAHLCKTVNTCHRLFEIKDFSVIHDSYGTHACNMDELAQTLRHEFVNIYRQDWLRKIYDEVRLYAPSVPLPLPPKMGEFNIEEVLDSEFFFA